MKNEMFEEIWSARERIARKNNYNLRKTVEYLRRLEANYPERVVSFEPRKPDPIWLTALPKRRPAIRRKREEKLNAKAKG